MRIKVYLSFLFFFIFFYVNAQSSITISGYVTDSNSGEKLIGATIIDSTKKLHAITNNYGFYSITISPEQLNLIYSYVGYLEKTIQINTLHDTSINIKLIPGSQIEEVIVKSTSRKQFINISNPGLINIPLKVIKQLPVILGEADILKSIQLLPGIQPGSEGSTGFYVRGGNSDNNLILLDGVEVFNPDHLFGFFSFFNDDAIKSVKIYKSNFPAQYDNRAASVVDIRTKDGNENRIKAKASIGLISSKAQIEGPIIKNKLTFIGSARRTYFDLFSKKLINRFTDYSNAGYYFFDLNEKISWKINKRNNLYISNYFGKDDGFFQSLNEFGEDPPEIQDSYSRSEREKSVNWSSSLLTTRFESILKPNLFLNLATSISNYNYFGNEIKRNIAKYWLNQNLMTINNKSSLSTSSEIKMQAISLDFDHYINQRHHLIYGSDFKLYKIQPALDSSFINPENSLESFFCKNLNIFFQDKISLGEKFIIQPGLNFNNYYVEDKSIQKFDKRIGLNYKVNERYNLNASWSEMMQFLHLLRFGKINLASDLWLPSFGSIKPTYSSDYSVGINVKINDAFSLNVDAYIRYYKNLLSYREGLIFNNQYSDISKIVTSGRGKARGIELSIEKKSGNFLAFLTYSFSISERTFPELNNGETFRSRYDRPQNLKIILSNTFNSHLSASCIFYFMSGALQTLPIGIYNSNYYLGANPWSYIQYSGGGTEIIIYKRNSQRLPLYHRLDLSIDYSINHKRLKQSLKIGLYNAYNAKNAYEMQTQIITSPNGKESRIQLTKKVLFPMIPFISYNIEIN